MRVFWMAPFAISMHSWISVYSVKTLSRYLHFPSWVWYLQFLVRILVCSFYWQPYIVILHLKFSPFISLNINGFYSLLCFVCIFYLVKIVPTNNETMPNFEFFQVSITRFCISPSRRHTIRTFVFVNIFIVILMKYLMQYSISKTLVQSSGFK